ncbi:hypothetical protein K503DRAFT_678072 [Rhizopogon vinicolor AM-OR11-026]|uniref:C2H2-type domain-containing protein n=1 Tax=Rhizopogon vinicolor AM-OR11-026 TaxID=1314800 RepID=A0A1B7NIZ3_9AGAM|nr:hypothetical protein K503DRAFT_678072 [Rhizopogon vinicolor AM-OR11-026]
MAERIVGRPWTTREDLLLVDAVAIHGETDNWKAVAHCVPGRTNKACRKASINPHRWLHSLSPNVKKSAWTPEEDHLLLELYQVHSTKWSVIARHIPGRTDDACSKRYREALDPSLRRDEWSKEEDCKLLDAYSRLLGRWGQVGQELQRSGLACRNRWRLLERKRTSLPLTDSQSVDVSNSSLTMSSDHSSPTLTYTHSPPWPTSPGPISLVPSGLGPIHEANSNYYATHRRQQLEHNLRHFVMPSSDPSAVSNVHREYYASPSSSDLCSPVSSVDAASCQHYQYYPSSEHAVPAHQDISPLSRPATATPDDCGDYYRTQPKGQPQLQFHSLSNEPELTLHRAPVPVSETAPPLAVPRSFYHVSPTQPSASVAPSAYARPREPCVLPKATGTVVKRGPPLDTSSPNPDDPNPRPASRPRSSVMRKRPDLHAPLRLSSDLPATNDSSIKPYACGHESCWPANAARSLACYTTSRGLSDHNKSAHPEDAGGDRPYRCGLEGCGKSWKSINGLQYHLQISKAHFQHAIVSTFVTSYIDGLTVPSVDYGEGDDKTKKQYSCPHQGCPNRYKQLSGLRYHLAHGHPSDLPVQLDLVPPALSRKLAEKMRKESASLQPPDA